FSVLAYASHSYPHSFPTRRSSDLLHRLSQLVVERTERLVQQEDARAQDERPRKRDPLLLPARELRRPVVLAPPQVDELERLLGEDRKSTRLNSSPQIISYAVFCLK